MKESRMAETGENHALVGTVVAGKYCIVGRVHQGRRNDLFLAQETVRDTVRSLVLKVPHELSNESAEILAREAGFLSVLDHPNVLGSVDVGSDDDRAYLVLDQVAGETLATAIERSGPMARLAALAIFWQILSAVRAMHEAGVVHRDLRPRNVFLEGREGHPPVVKVIDFASAKFVRPDHPDAKSEPSYPIGAHRYMAPEQHRGDATGPAVDIYAVGMMLHAALVGELPEPGSRLRDHQEAPPELEEVIAVALAEEPSKRFRSALAFQDALTRALLVGG